MSQQDEDNFKKALALKKSIEFEYHQIANDSGSTKKRYGNPYALYWAERPSNLFVEIEQTSGFSLSGRVGFRSFEYGFVKNVVILDDTFQTSKNYNPQSKRYQYPKIKYLAKID